MREIKFRAWNPKVGMSEIVSLEFAHGLRLIPADIDSGRNDLSDDKWVLMQFTGLKDKNGREIYEGDVVKYKISAKERFIKGEVIFKDSAWVISGKYRDVEKNEEYMRCLDEEDEMEVIGNIHENPELLK